MFRRIRIWMAFRCVSRQRLAPLGSILVPSGAVFFSGSALKNWFPGGSVALGTARPPFPVRPDLILIDFRPKLEPNCKLLGLPFDLRPDGVVDLSFP